MQILPEDEGSFPCLYLIFIVVVLFVIYVALYLIQRFSKKSDVIRVCSYCGRAVRADSECHHAPVTERFGSHICTACGNKTEIVCSKCRRPLK